MTMMSDEERGALRRLIFGGGEMDTDQESVGSTSETESPRSVAASPTTSAAAKGRRWKWNCCKGGNNIDVYVHSQIVRIRSEDSHIGEDVKAEIFAGKDKISAAGHVASVVLLRPILPASPLGGPTAFTA